MKTIKAYIEEQKALCLHIATPNQYSLAKQVVNSLGEDYGFMDSWGARCLKVAKEYEIEAVAFHFNENLRVASFSQLTQKQIEESKHTIFNPEDLKNLSKSEKQLEKHLDEKLDEFLLKLDEIEAKLDDFAKSQGK